MLHFSSLGKYKHSRTSNFFSLYFEEQTLEARNILVPLIYQLNNFFSRSISSSGAFYVYSTFDTPSTNIHGPFDLLYVTDRDIGKTRDFGHFWPFSWVITHDLWSREDFGAL